MKTINISQIKRDSMAIANAYPKQYMMLFGVKAVRAALVRIATRSDPKPKDVDKWPPNDPALWLLARTEQYRDSQKGSDMKYVPSAKKWFDGGGYLEDPKSWSRGNDDPEDVVKRLAEASRRDV